MQSDRINLAREEIEQSWNRCGQMTLEQGLEFGKICCKWRKEFITSLRGIAAKNQGLSPILDSIGIPKSTAYFWMDRYTKSQQFQMPDENVDFNSRQTERQMKAKEIEKEIQTLLPGKVIAICPTKIASGDGIGFNLEFRGLSRDEVLEIIHAIKQTHAYLREEVKKRVKDIEEKLREKLSLCKS